MLLDIPFGINVASLTEDTSSFLNTEIFNRNQGFGQRIAVMNSVSHGKTGKPQENYFPKTALNYNNQFRWHLSSIYQLINLDILEENLPI